VALAVGIAAGGAWAAEVAVTQKDRAFSVKEIALNPGEARELVARRQRCHRSGSPSK
jgi:hypothetical protein